MSRTPDEAKTGLQTTPTDKPGDLLVLDVEKRKPKPKPKAKVKVKAEGSAKDRRKAKAKAKEPDAKAVADLALATKRLDSLADKIREQDKVAVTALKAAEKPIAKSESFRETFATELEKVLPLCLAAGEKQARLRERYKDVIGRSQFYLLAKVIREGGSLADLRLIESDKKRRQRETADASLAAERTEAALPARTAGNDEDPEASAERMKAALAGEPVAQDNVPGPTPEQIEEQTGITPANQAQFIRAAKEPGYAALREFRAACGVWLPKLRNSEQCDEAEKIFAEALKPVKEKASAA
jgi:hypothetical protein